MVHAELTSETARFFVESYFLRIEELYCMSVCKTLSSTTVQSARPFSANACSHSEATFVKFIVKTLLPNSIYCSGYGISILSFELLFSIVSVLKVRR